MSLAIQHDRGEVVAKFERNDNLPGRCRFAGPERQGRIGDAAALVVECAGCQELGRAGEGANRGNEEPVDGVFGGGEADNIQAVGRRPDDFAGFCASRLAKDA